MSGAGEAQARSARRDAIVRRPAMHPMHSAALPEAEK
jgi:hypothetical protein